MSISIINIIFEQKVKTYTARYINSSKCFATNVKYNSKYIVFLEHSNKRKTKKIPYLYEYVLDTT